MSLPLPPGNGSDVLVVYRTTRDFTAGDPLPGDRRPKRDRILVVRDGVVKASVSASTWPYEDTNGRTVVLMPGSYPAAYAVGQHNGRDGITLSGYSPARVWTYTQEGTYTGADKGWFGINIHSDRGVSEGCLTTEGEGPIATLRRALVIGSKTHPNGYPCHDLHLYHVDED